MAVKGLLLLLLSLVLLMVSVVLLYVLNDTTIGAELGIIVMLMTFFAGSQLHMTKAKRHEVFVSAAT